MTPEEEKITQGIISGGITAFIAWLGYSKAREASQSDKEKSEREASVRIAEAEAKEKELALKEHETDIRAKELLVTKLDKVHHRVDILEDLVAKLKKECDELKAENVDLKLRLRDATRKCAQCGNCRCTCKVCLGCEQRSKSWLVRSADVAPMDPGICYESVEAPEGDVL